MLLTVADTPISSKRVSEIASEFADQRGTTSIAARRRQFLATHPRVGPLTALAFVLILGLVERFNSGRQVASYIGARSRGRVQRRSLAARTYQQAGQHLAAFSDGRRGAQATLRGNSERWSQHPLWRCDEEERLTGLEIDFMLKPTNYGSSPDAHAGSHTPCLPARLAYKRNC